MNCPAGMIGFGDDRLCRCRYARSAEKDRSFGKTEKSRKLYGKEEWREMDKTYAGRIGQTGSQVVKAPNQLAPKKGGGKVKKGEDLRTGRK